MKALVERGKQIAVQLGEGINYNGPQMYGEIFLLHLFTDSVTDTTFSARTLEQAQMRLVEVRRSYKAPAPSYPDLPDHSEIIEGLMKDLDRIRKTLTKGGRL